MRVRAAFFDVGDTLVEHWAPPERIQAVVREALVEAFGERGWLDALIAAELEPTGADDPHRQETNRWYEAWFAGQGLECDVDVDRLRSAFAVPLDLVSTPARGGAESLRWCKGRGLAVVLVTNTLSRGDAEVLRDWARFGLADTIDAVVSSHDVGWRKPHPAIFERALALAKVRPAEAFMVGNDLEADVRGAQALGLRAVWRRLDGVPDPHAIRPDATIRTMDELPAAVWPWLS